MDFNYSLTPGIKLNKQNKLKIDMAPVISIITPYYNGGKYINETAISVLNQTFPYYEWLIIDDESTDLESIQKLKEIEKIDSRIKILYKKNSGPSETRDYGAKNSCSSSKYFLFLDADDLICKTYLECAYLTLETNKNASWAYTDVVNFGESEFLWVKNFNDEIEKKDNLLCVTALIRKDDFFKVNGYAIKEKAIFEDWNLWLKMMAENMYPVRMSFLGFWYRKKAESESELCKAILNNKKSKEIIKQTAGQIKQEIKAIQYPRQDYHWDKIEDFKDVLMPKYLENNKINILYIMPWVTMGGADRFNIDLIKGLDKDKFEIIVITTEPNINPWMQELEKHIDCLYNLTTFLDRKYWPTFINYIIQKNNINLILNTNSTFGYNVLPYIKAHNPNVPIIDYIHMEEWYNRNGGFSRDSSSFSSIIDKTLVCNENSRKILIEHFDRNPNEIETVYIGVDEKEFNPINYFKKDIILKYNIPDNKYLISFIARIDIQKRPYLLLQIIKALQEQRNDFLFLIAGDGPLLNEIKTKAKHLNIEKNIKFLGSVNDTKQIYAISDMTINCSIKEGLALTSYESLSMNVPIVSSNVGGQSELINNDVGIIVPCLQKEEEILDFNYSQQEITNYIIAINKILNDLNFYKENCRKRILNQFTIGQMVKKTNSIFENIAKNPNKDKIKIGNDLFASINILKELITKYFIAHGDLEYGYLCNEFNKNFFGDNFINTNNCFNQKIIKLTLKLHLYNEAKIIYKILNQIYCFLKSILELLVQFFKLIILRIRNIFRKILHKKGIKYD